MAKSTHKSVEKEKEKVKLKAKGETKGETESPSSLVEVAPPAIEEDSDSNSDSEYGGVDEEGMERLMKALGEDGLNEFDHAMLRGSEDGSEEEGEDNEEVEDEGELSDESDDDEDGEEGEDGEEDEEQFVAVDEEDVELEPDAVPEQKLEIDNETALARIRETIQLEPTIPWTETLVLSYPQTIDVDVNDDLNRELSFYKQALHGATEAKRLASKHKLPFTRPSDYFAEMVKSDSHMERIRQRLLDESAGMKKSEEKRREREGKKFGKQVQIEKLKERERNKKDMEERLKGLKRSESLFYIYFNFPLCPCKKADAWVLYRT
ncbi:hypothetical protein E1B28_012071 [Marasmius oreades]|uniref:rRNA-processing protein EBP2 n=1 Tax=Marasmius oreades TaxID=181124 RepID=A0A9P7UPJ0_9AGAR|nr:uncharacterized protein E1B28_012071 [Marasmius oreades]KAG7088036.1 hypothetical protein E1B28_012071 [Marasmius oreades]